MLGHMRTADRREEMRRLLARRQREGLTFAELSRQTRIPVGTLAWWSSRLRSEPAGDRAGFVELTAEVEPQVQSRGGGRLEVVLVGGRRLIVPCGFDAGEVLRLVRALEAGC